MKTLYLLFITTTLIILISSCAGTRDMEVQVLRPALISVPQQIKTIAVLNRSIPTAPNVESALTGETPVQDKELSAECLRGLTTTLNTSNRFKFQQVDYTLDAADPKSLSFGVPMSWESVDTLCARLQVDGLLVLEYFDTDFSVNNPVGAAGQIIQGIANGGQTSVTVTGTATANAGFRVYYAKERTMAYEDNFNYRKRWQSRANNAFEAVGKLVKRNAALIDVSYETGFQFAKNIVPLYFWENRLMYKGKKGELQKGERQALSKDWEGAKLTWMYVYENSLKSKERGKAAYNTALAFEVLGDLNEAQKWATRAYVESGKKDMLRYSEILDFRLREQDRLKEQIPVEN